MPHRVSFSYSSVKFGFSLFAANHIHVKRVCDSVLTLCTVEATEEFTWRRLLSLRLSDMFRKVTLTGEGKKPQVKIGPHFKTFDSIQSSSCVHKMLQR